MLQPPPGTPEFRPESEPCSTRRVALMIYAPALAILVFTLLASRLPGFDFGFFSREPTATLNGHPLTGALSNLGILVWCVGAAVCFFTWSVARRPESGAGTGPGSFFFWSGVLTTFLLVDDLFRVHEDMAWDLIHVSENHVLAGYVLLAAAYVVRFRTVLLDAPDQRPFFFAATVFFALSLAIDFREASIDSSWRIVFEDGFKLLGIFSWTGYLVWSAWLRIDWRPRSSQNPEPVPPA